MIVTHAYLRLANAEFLNAYATFPYYELDISFHASRLKIQAGIHAQVRSL